MTFRSVLAGVLVLTGLEAIVSSSEAANRTGGILTGIGWLAERALDPGVAAIPPRAQNKATTAAAQNTGIETVNFSPVNFRHAPVSSIQ